MIVPRSPKINRNATNGGPSRGKMRERGAEFTNQCFIHHVMGRVKSTF
jgi:hypothetical protein